MSYIIIQWFCQDLCLQDQDLDNQDQDQDRDLVSQEQYQDLDSQDQDQDRDLVDQDQDRDLVDQDRDLDSQDQDSTFKTMTLKKFPFFKTMVFIVTTKSVSGDASCNRPCSPPALSYTGSPPR